MLSLLPQLYVGRFTLRHYFKLRCMKWCIFSNKGTTRLKSFARVVGCDFGPDIWLNWRLFTYCQIKFLGNRLRTHFLLNPSYLLLSIFSLWRRNKLDTTLEKFLLRHPLEHDWGVWSYWSRSSHIDLEFSLVCLGIIVIISNS
jgi:hypothetical protein